MLPKRDFPADFFARDADDAAGLMEALGKTWTTQMGKFHFYSELLIWRVGKGPE